MPLREYECKKCKHRFENIEKFSDKPQKKCPKCGGPLEETISAPAVQFKGSGWYVTDYARKGQSSASSSSSPSSSESSSSGSEGSSKEGSSKESAKESKKDEKTKSETTAKRPKKD